MPALLPGDQPLSDVAYFEFIKAPGSSLEPVFPPGPSVIRSDGLPAMIEALRQIVRSDYPNGDERG